jgi:hypothetical protein
VSALNACVNQAELIRAAGHGGLSTVNGYGAIFYDPAGAYPKGLAPLRGRPNCFTTAKYGASQAMILL